jgi:polysaccharide export outer membrane protein
MSKNASPSGRAMESVWIPIVGSRFFAAGLFFGCARIAALIGGLAFSAPLLADPIGDSAAYKLAPGDRITVTIFGQPDLSGDMLIDNAGNIVLPFLEPLAVRGLTILECQQFIRDRLADGILRQPSVSVRVSELRPLYVLGDVRTPGAYPFRYGSTAQSAVALAGGFGLAEPLQNTAVTEFLLADERVRQLTFQKQTLLIRRARLEAQRDGLSTFSPPTPSGATENKDIPGIVANEKDVFEAQGAILRSQLELMRAQKPRLEKEIEAENQQIAAGTKQLEAIKQETDRIDRLVKQGLATQNVGFQLKVSEASQEMNVWRLMAEVSRLQIASGELDLKIQDAEASFKKQAVVELREARERLNELEATLPSAREIRDVKLQYAGGVINVAVRRSIAVTRTRNGQSAVFEATETTALEPGDIVEVKRLLPRETSRQSASVTQPAWQPPQGGTGIANLIDVVPR